MELTIIDSRIGERPLENSVVLRGQCSFCEDKATFRQIGTSHVSEKLGLAVAILCEGCEAIQIYSKEKNKIYPEPLIKGIKDLPIKINNYYQESLRCISYDCPNGAMTLFRKLIHQLGIHYEIAIKNDEKKLYEIINGLNTTGHVPEKLRAALIEVKDFGNDGAHVNENEPDIKQALKIKQLIDSVLSSSLMVDKTLEELRGIRENSLG